MNFWVHHEVEHFDDVCSEFPPVHDVIDHSVLEQKLGALKVLWEFLSNGLFDNSWTSETDQCFRLSDYYITEHGETCRDSSRRWIGQNRDEGKSRFVERGESCRYFRHLHQREGAFLHAGATRSRKDHKRTAFVHRAFD